MSPDFEKAFKEVVGHEGVFSSDPSDPGNWTGGKPGLGELKGTKYGISAKSYPNRDIALLTLEDAKDIYWRDFWLALQCHKMPFAVGRVVFMQGVNQGVGRITRNMQEALEVVPDGKIGPKTLTALMAVDPVEFIVKFQAECILDYSQSPDFQRYGKGWVRRAVRTAVNAVSELT